MDLLAVLMLVIKCVLFVESSVKISNVGIVMCRYRCKVTGGCKSITFISTQLQCYLNFDNTVTEDESSDSVTRVVQTTCLKGEQLLRSGGKNLCIQHTKVFPTDCSSVAFTQTTTTTTTATTTKRIYRLFRVKLHWYDAKYSCGRLGGILAIMDTPQIFEDVKAFLKCEGNKSNVFDVGASKIKTSLWVGMSKEGKLWKWSNGNSMGEYMVSTTDGVMYGAGRCAALDPVRSVLFKGQCYITKLSYLCEMKTH